MGIILKIAWRNLGRNRRRTLLTLASVVLATMLLTFMFAMQLGGYGQMIDTTCRMSTGHMQIQNKDFLEDPSIENTVQNPDQIMRLAEAAPHIEAIAPRIQAGALISHGDSTTGALITGIDPDREKKLTTIATLIKEGELFESGDTSSAVVGKDLAINAGLGIGDEFVILGQAADGSMAVGRYKVKGIFSTGMPDLDAVMVYIDLGGAQETFALYDQAHNIAMLLDRYDKIPEVKELLTNELAEAGLDQDAVRDWGEILPGLKQGIQLDMSSGLLMYSVLLIVVAFGIMNTFVMIAFERVKEFGVLMAMGLKPFALALMLFIESMLMTSLGIFVGWVIGGAVAYYFSIVGIPLGKAAESYAQWGISSHMYPLVIPKVFIIAGILVLIVAFLSSLYPAWRVTRYKPVEALRHI